MQVRAHEPHQALDGGGGPGTDALEAICRGAIEMLRPGGFLALETAGGKQAHAVADMLRALVSTATSSDLTGESSERHLAAGQSSEPGSPGPSLPPMAFEAVEIVSDCFEVERFVVAKRT